MSHRTMNTRARRTPPLVMTLALLVGVAPQAPAATHQVVILPSLERHLSVSEDADGYAWMDLNDPEFQGHVSQEDLDASTSVVVSSDPANLEVNFSAPNGAGGANTFPLRGAIAAGEFSGTVELEDGRPIPVVIPGASTLDAVVAAFAVVPIVCVIAALYTECQDACREACGGRLESCTETWCGRCKSTCYPPLQAEEAEEEETEQ